MTDVESFVSYLLNNHPNFSSIIKTFEQCSKDDQNNRYLVDDKTKCIDFDDLTEWTAGRGNKPNSADSLCFSENQAFLIEFKTGNPMTHPNKYNRLIANVADKITDSDNTLSALYQNAFNGVGRSRIKQNFFLVVDSARMGADPLAITLAQLSARNNSNPDPLITRIQNGVLSLVPSSNNYYKIELWYSAIFSSYIKAYGIIDITDTIASVQAQAAKADDKGNDNKG